MNENDSALSDPYLLAMHFEQVAKDLYADLAQISDNADTRMIFARLSKEEAGHIGLFRNLRTAHTSKPPTAECTEQALALMRAHILPVPGTVSAIALLGDLKKALELALRMEQDSILFYRGLMSLKPDLQGDLARIIQEEQRHSQIIVSLLEAAQDGGTPVQRNLLSK